MAQQIKKKYIEDNAVDGEKLLLLPTQTLRKLNSSGVEVDVIQQLVDADAALQIEIDAEEVARQLGDDALQGAITSEEAARIAGDAALQGEIDAEEAARAAADTALQNAIDAEAAARAAADTVVATAVQEVVEAEVEARIAADTALQGEIDAEEMARAAGDAALQGAIDAEAAARVAADSALQGAIDAEAAARVAADSALQGEIDAEETRALAAEAALQSAIDAEELAREQGDSALDARVSPIEKRYQVNKFTIYENNAQVYADAQPGVQDPSGQLRDGWYYTNASAGQKINWYYFDGINNATVTLGAMSAYAVMTFDGLGSMPLLAVYTKPTGSGDLMPGFARSRVVYSGSSTGLTIGKKYLVYFGENPTVHPELPRVQLVKSTSSSAGSQGASEEVLTVSFGSNSGASVGSVKFMTESLGIWSESYKHEVSLRIRQASQLSLNNEQAARAAADSALQSAIDAEAAARIAGDSAAQSSVAAEQAARELADSALQAAIAAEQARAETAESGLQSQIDTEKGRIDAILLASDADKDSFAEIVNLINSVDTENDSAFASYVLSNDAAVAQLQTDLSDEAIARAAADTALSEAIATEATNRAQEIAEEVAAREAADTALSADISDEVARALAAEEALDGKIDQEIMDRSAADSALQTAITAEETARIAADSALQASLDQEISDRQAAVSAEEAARIAGDAATLASAQAYTDSLDDVKFFSALSAFPATGSNDVMYVAMDTNRIYHWKTLMVSDPNGGAALFSNTSSFQTYAVPTTVPVSNRSGSSIYLTSSGTVSSGSVHMYRGSSAAGTFVVRLYSATPGASGGVPQTLLASSSPINVSTLPSSSGAATDVNFTFTSSVSLSANTEYCLVVDGANITSGFIFWSRSAPLQSTVDGQQRDAKLFYSADGSSWTENGQGSIRATLRVASTMPVPQYVELSPEPDLSTIQSNIATLQSGLASEITARTSADTTLQSNIDAEASARAAADTALQTALSALESFNIAQVMHVSKSGSDTTGTGGQHKPYLTISKALSMITDATPSKRYVVRVSAGAYTETSVALPSNVFVVGESKESVRITGPVSMGAWTQNNSGSDDRSGFSMVSLLSEASFDWSAAKSRAGKLYMNEVAFGSTVSLYGYDNAIAQAQFNACVVFGAMTISGVNVGAFTNNVCFSDVTLNQHPNGGMATFLAATGGSVGGTLRLNTTVNDFNRRCSAFLKSFYSENLIVDGAASYADCDLVSQGKSSTQKLNGGNFVALSPRINHSIETELVKPLANNAHNTGDWGRQWFFNFAYVHASAGTDMYVLSAMQNYDPAGDSEGRSIFILSDGYGLKPDVSGGDIQLETAAVSGTGVRGKIKLDGKEIDVSSKQIKSLAAGTAATDAVNVSQLESGIAAEQARAEAAESGLQSQIDTEKGRIDAILLASDADKDSFAEIVTLINSVDTENDTAFAGYVLSNDAAVQALEDAVADLESAVASVVQFHKESFTVDATMISDGYVDVTHLAKPNSMVLFVGRLAMLEGHDYSLSTVGGVTRVTFLAPMLTPSEEALAVGDKLFFTYAK